jgi:hypothetical protein
MACERYRDALSDVAAGAAAPAGVEAHLASCAACRAELAALRRALAVADAELGRLSLAEPSPELGARIRATVAESAQTERGWRLGWGVPLTAAAAVFMAGVFVAQRGPRPEPAPTAAEHQPARETSRATPVPDSVVPTIVQHSRLDASERRAASPPRQERAREPEVLVPSGEAEALVSLAASLRRRSVTPDSLLVADLSAPLAEPQVGEIHPLEIVPLSPEEDSGAE